MKKMSYEESKNALRERSNAVTQMLHELKAGREVDLSQLSALIALGHANESALIAEVESYRQSEILEDIINNIDVPSFMKK